MTHSALTNTAVLSILREAQAIGMDPLLRTTLHKFVYLLDVYSAGEMEGQTFTGETWRFLHFGPFAPAVAESIDELVGRGDIFFAGGTRTDDEVEFNLYTVRRGLAPSLRDIGVPKSAALRLISDIHRFAKSLPDLLDYIYYGTAPMTDVEPGRTLDFRNCESMPLSAFKPIAMKPIPKKRLARAREKIHAILDAQNAERHEIPTGPYDEAYFTVLATLDDSLPVGLTGRATIITDE